MGKPIQWETSLTKAKIKARQAKKMILIDFVNHL